MLNSKLIKLLSLALVIAASTNLIAATYSWPYHEEEGKHPTTNDFFASQNSLDAVEEAGNYFGLPVQLLTRDNGIVQVSTTFTEDTIDDINELLKRIESISWAKLHKISLDRPSNGNLVEVSAFFLK